MARTDRKVTAYCIIEAPNDVVRDEAGAARIARVMDFDVMPCKDRDGKYDPFVLHLNEDDATAIVCEVLMFAGRYMPTPSMCTHVAKLRLVRPGDYVKVCAMEGWKKIPIPQKEPAPETTAKIDDAFLDHVDHE